MKVQSPTHGDRRRASNDETATRLLNELEAVLEKFNKQAGIVGNLEGNLKTAQRALDEGKQEANRLEEKARRIRQAFDVYMGHEDLIDATPG